MPDKSLNAETLSKEHRKLGETVTRILGEYMLSLDQRDVVPPASVEELVSRFDEAIPQEGASSSSLLEFFETGILPEGMQISSPRYYGLFNPTPLPIAVWADALASAINQNGAVWRNSSAANVIEARVIHWLCDQMGFPTKSFGTLTSGGSEANLVAMKCARDVAGAQIRDRGLIEAGRPLAVYASDQCHYSFIKSVDILGLGRESLRKIPTDSNFRIKIAELRKTMQRDREAGITACAIAGAAGATSSGAIDPLEELSSVAREFDCWFHVDAAYGGPLAFSEKYGSRLKGIELADSITIDPHKWMFVPFACGAVLVREGGNVLRRSFDITPEYLSEDRGGADVEYDLFRYGQLGTHRFNALKLWMALKYLGVVGYRNIIDRQVELTEYFANRIDSLPEFQRAGNVQTAVCCFRFLPDSLRALPGEEQDLWQQALQQRVEKSGKAWFATTILNGRRVIRINVNSFLTEERHLDDLIELIRTEAKQLHRSGK